MEHRRLTDTDLKVFRKAIGSGFKKLREKAGKSIAEISIAVSIQPHNLEQLEIGNYDMELTEYIDLCHYFKVTPADFMEKLEVD